MSTWSFILTPGGDITSSVDVPSITKTERLFSEMRPNSNYLQFRVVFSSGLLSTLLSNQAPALVVTKDGADYFTGVLSPNWETSIKLGTKFIDLRAEDYTLSKLGQTVSSSLICSGFAVCDPAAPSSSLVHVIAAAAGVTLAGGAPTISTTVPYVCVLPSDKRTYQGILSTLLYEFLYVYYFNASGALVLTPSINTGTITTTATFDIATDGGEIRESLGIKKEQVKYDDVRISYRTIDLKSTGVDGSALVLYQDTAGAQGSNAATIPLSANGDATGKDYYPVGSDKGEIFAQWNNPDGYEIYAAVTASLDDVVAESGISISRDLTNYNTKASFAYHNTNAYSANITRMKIIGSAYVVTAQNVARSSSSGKQALEYDASYVFDTASAQDLARAVYQYYAYSDITYTLKSHTDIAVGSYALISDSVWSALSQKCRIVGKTKSERTKSYNYTLEAVADYSSITLVLEGKSTPIFSNALDALVHMSSDLTITPQEKAAILIRWADINGDGFLSGSYWQSRKASIEAGIPTSSLEYYYGILFNSLYHTPGVLIASKWNSNITVDSGFPLLWADYYRAESLTMSTISKWASFGSIVSMDMGTYDSLVSPDYAPEYDGSSWSQYQGEEDEGVYDFGTWSVSAYDSELDLGVYDGSSNPDLIDCSDWDASLASLYNPPALIMDCGDFA